MRKLLLQNYFAGLANNFLIFKISLIIIFFAIGTKIYSQCSPVSGQITGSILEDINFNANVDYYDKGINGIKIFAYDKHQNLIATDITDPDGNYTLAGLTDGTQYRVELLVPELYTLVKSYKDLMNLTSPTCGIKTLFHKPTAYTHSNPGIVMPMFMQGKTDEYQNNGVILTFPSNFTNSTLVSESVRKSELGSVWGVAFKRSTQQLFSSAFVKQYAYLGNGGFGAIYISKKSINGWNTSLFADLKSLGINLGSLSVTDPQNCDYGAQSGYIGLGSIDLTDDEKYLYITNLFKNTLVKLPTDKSKFYEIEEIQIPNPGCIGGNMHAFALKNYKGKLYVGVTCGAELSKDEVNNTIHIYEYDYNNKSFTEIFQTSYPRGYWSNTPSHDVKVQHWLTDIDFTKDGNMILVLNDRIGHRYCSGTAGRLDVQNGDILMVWNNNGIWTLENNGKAGALTGSGVGNAQGPGGGEFFGYDYWPTNPTLHPETVTGSALVIDGTDEIVVPVYDPESSAYSGGIKKFGTKDGSLKGVFSVYTHKTYPQFGKASAFGDVDAIYDPIPLEIGDFVWIDDDKDGIQDPDEHGIAGLNLSLYDENCIKIGRTVTNSEGFYVFNNTNVDLNNDGKFESPDILKQYYVVIDDNRFSSDNLSYNSKSYYLTIFNKGVGENKNLNNSDCQIASNICPAINGFPYIPVFTESSGQNKYDADFGFSEVKIFDLALRKTLVTQNTVSFGDTVTFKISIFNQGTVTAKNIFVTDYINTGYEYDETKNTEWIFSGNKAVFRYLDELKPGSQFDAYIKLIVKPNSKLNEFINYAEISSALNPDGNIANDVDSKMDDILGNDKGGEINYGNSLGVQITDDLIDDDGTIDEDDHDGATPYIFDLALIKKIFNEKLLYKTGETITFEINVYNQGSVSAKSYEIVDYLNDDFIFDPSINPEWIKTNAKLATLKVNEELKPFSSKQFFIKLRINPATQNVNLKNYAEISAASTNISNSKDYDSTPNTIVDDDPGALPGTITQHNIYLSAKSPVPDEDDHDLATLSIQNYDLALVKKALQHNIKEGDKVSFEIEVFNQGAITADNISIVDYLDTGFILNDPKWKYYPGNNSKAELLLSVANGLLPPVGLLPGKSVKTIITLLLQHVDDGVNFLTNEVEIKSSYDIAGNNLGIYDKDSSPDDIKTNDKKGTDDQLNGNGTDDEDDHDWATIFVRSELIVDPCICLNNASDPYNGQFRIEVAVISPSGQNWRIDSIAAFYNLTSPMPPAAPVLYALGTPLIETLNDPIPGLSRYWIQAININEIPYYIRVVNDLGDKQELSMHSGLCHYEIPEIIGSIGTCTNNTVEYKINNPNTSAVYSWSLPVGGTILGSNIGNSVNIQWGNTPGIYDLRVIDNTASQCIAPQIMKVKIGNNGGALSADDYVIASVDYDCQIVVTPDMILNGTVNPNTPFEVTLFDSDGNLINGNIITSEYINQEILAVLTDLCGGQKAETTIKTVDYISPVIDCNEIEIECDNMANYPGPVVTDNCDNDPLLIIVNETSELQNCSDDFLKVIERKYIAFDKYGNISEPCTQKINVKRLNKSEVIFPQNWLISDNSALTCGAYKTDKNGNPDPSVTGTPHYHGKDLFKICSDNFCEVTVGYNDFVANECDCSKKIIRTWHVFENCEDITFSNLITYFQVIEIHDLIPPIPVPPTNFTVYTDGLTCSTLVNLPSLTITDNCSDKFKVDIIYPGGVLNDSNGGIVRLEAGSNDIIYNVYDKCNNLTTVTLNVKVIDKTPPVVICQRNTVVSLPPSGEAIVPALVFDSGSYDDCQINGFEVKRKFKDDFGPDVKFICSDLDSNNINVILRAYDTNGNWNECLINVVIQHKYLPTISCPDPMTVNCDFAFDLNNLPLYFGNATATDVCGVTISEGIPLINISQCGVGKITRYFTATGRGGMTKQCEQTIKFINPKPFSIADIKWPNDKSITGCGIELLSPNSLGWPILNEGPCDIVGYNYSDSEFYGVQDDACYTIVRRWSVIDMCQRENGEYKKWFYDQTIHVTNNEKPVIASLSDIEICTYDDNCKEGFVNLTASASDVCTAKDDLQWRFSIDLFSNGSIDSSGYQIGGTAILSGKYPVGNHKIIWTVEDRCGNYDTKTQIFKVKLCTKPTAICLDNLVVELGAELVNGDTIGIARMIARYFDHGSYHTCGYPLKYSFSANPKDTLLTVDCGWLSDTYHEITLYVTDPFGNQDFCSTKLEVQDNYYVCDPFSRCIIWPKDTIIVASCNPDLTPGAGIADKMIANDKCGCSNFNVTHQDQTINDPNSTCTEIHRIWKVDFNCASLDTTIQFLQVFVLKNSETPPLNCISPPIANAGPNCNAFVNIGVPTYLSDECSENLTLSHNSLYASNPGINASGTYPVGTTQVTFKLTDICGHQSSCMVNVVVKDQTNPVCVPNNATIALNSSGQVTITGNNVAAGSYDNCGISTITVAPSLLNCANLGINNILITVKDIHNNISTCTAQVTIIDTLTQLCNAKNATLVLNNNGTGILNPTEVYAGSGGCGGSANVTLQVIPNTFNCSNIGQNTVQLIVTDIGTGQSDTCSAIVTVIDHIAPQCLVKNDTVYLNNNGIATFTFNDINDGSFDPCGVITNVSMNHTFFTCVDEGTNHSVTVTLTDNSGNISTCQALIFVKDTIKPVCVAADTLEIPLDNSGMAVITGQTVDYGSYDQCEFLTLTVNPDTFYCNDAGIPIEFILTVGDGNGNFSTCTGIIIVRDTTPPNMICPSDTTVSCLNLPEPDKYTEVFGEPVIYDNCSQGGNYDEAVIENINDCGGGIITRNFSVEDPSGNESSCIQLITVLSAPDNFSQNDITWPDDTLYVFNCSTINPDELFSTPILNLTKIGCAQITITYSDISQTPGIACSDTLNREWTVKDFCQYSSDPNTGIYKFTQTLIIIEDGPPIIDIPNDTSIVIPDELCDNIMYIDLYGSVTDCDENVIITNDSPFANNNNSADASGIYPIGRWKITVSATDHCGNTTIKNFNLTVTMNSFCQKAQNFLMPESEILEVYVDEVSHPLPPCSDLSWSDSDPNVDSLVFDCNDINQFYTFKLYRFNLEGKLLDSCYTTFGIDDPYGYCSGNIIPGIVGTLSTVNNYGVEDAEIYLSGTENTKLTTEYNGLFEYSPPLPEGDYTVKPKKNTDFMNGVNTNDIIQIQKHILGIKKLDSPFKYIAADVDNSRRITASDILVLRKLILGEINEFKNNESWKFIDFNYKFQNAEDALNEPYNESQEVKKLNKTIRTDFTGIKIGDVNNSVIANKLMALAPRSSENIIIDIDEKMIVKGENIIVQFKNKDTRSLEGLQFTLEFDPESIEYTNIEGSKLVLSKENIGLKNIGKGIITLSWNDIKAVDLSAGSELFTIEFKVKKSGLLSDQLRINSSITEAIAFDYAGQELGIVLYARNQNSDDFVLYQNEPNPWASSTNLRYELPNSGNVKVTISTGYGVKLYEKTVAGKTGTNFIEIQKDNINYNGLLLVDLEFEGKHQIIKMIKF